MPRSKRPRSIDSSRRRTLKGIGGALGAVALGCSGSESETPHASATSTGSGGPGGAGPGSASSSVTGGAGPGGGGGSGGAGGGIAPSCTDTGGLSPEELLAKIDTWVIVCMENRSFDHYLGSLLHKEGKEVLGLDGSESNLDANGMPVPVFNLLDETPADPPHGWDPVHEQWNMGLNDGFVKAHAGADEKDVMGYYVREQLPITYALSDSFAVCDRWFCSVLGPTWPNRFYLHGATSKGNKSNTPALGFTSIFDLCDEAGVSSKNYYSDIAWASGGYFKVGGLGSIEGFFADAAAGVLPQVSIVDPNFFGGNANDDHPDHPIANGQAFLASVFAALAQSPQWGNCCLVVTYDEHGGFFNHVPPPATSDDDPEFAQLGIRVPTIVAGPFARKGCAVSTQLEHVSVIATLTKRYGLRSLNQRVAATNDFSSCINPAYLGAPQKPPILPQVSISMSELRRNLARTTRIHQPELWTMAELGLIPRHLDRRSESDAIVRRVLAEGARLGAVRIVD